jgi:peptidoglycan/LPS O-acetylase OafA/YrhL
MVLTTHVFLFYVPRKVFVWLPGGFLGLEIFFVLSGFLITSLLLGEHRRNGAISFRKFYTRRARRLLPALFAMLAGSFVYTVLTGQNLRIEVRSSLSALFYAMNWVIVTRHQVVNNHLWSLAVEEQFYAIWPLLAALMLTFAFTRRHPLGIIGAAVIGLTIWTAILWVPSDANFVRNDTIYCRTDVQAVPLLIGAMAAYAWSRHLFSFRLLRLFAWPSLVFMCVCAWKWSSEARFYYHGGLAIFSIASAFLILACADRRFVLAEAFSLPPFPFFGRISYGVYLWHIPVFVAVARYGRDWSAFAQVVVALGVTFIFALFSWYLIETPFLRARPGHAEVTRAKRDKVRKDAMLLAMPIQRGHLD